MKSVVLVALAGLIYSLQAFAGQNVGGGDAVVCYEADGTTIKSAMLYDFYEAISKDWGFAVDLGGDELKAVDKVRYALSRLKQHDSLLSNKLEAGLNFFLSSHTLTTANLAGVPDVDPLILPSAECKFEQLAIQQEPETPRDRYFFIVKRIWEKLDENNKAGLILHEIYYKHILKTYKPENSLPIRYMNMMISSSNGVSAISTKDYLQILRDFKIPAKEFEYRGILLCDRMLFNKEGQIVFAIAQEQELNLKNAETHIPQKAEVIFDNDRTHLRSANFFGIKFIAFSDRASGLTFNEQKVLIGMTYERSDDRRYFEHRLTEYPDIKYFDFPIHYSGVQLSGFVKASEFEINSYDCRQECTGWGCYYHWKLSGSESASQASIHINSEVIAIKGSSEVFYHSNGMPQKIEVEKVFYAGQSSIECSNDSHQFSSFVTAIKISPYHIYLKNQNGEAITIPGGSTVELDEQGRYLKHY